MQYSVYDRETGRILRYVNYPEEHKALAIQNDGEALFNGHVDATAYMIRNSRKVTRPPDPPAPVAAWEVKAEAERRILSRFPLWKQLNMIRAGEDLSEIDAIRAASNRIERMDPIPLDFRDDKYWTEAP
jgi:hypothetical protein